MELSEFIKTNADIKGLASQYLVDWQARQSEAIN